MKGILRNGGKFFSAFLCVCQNPSLGIVPVIVLRRVLTCYYFQVILTTVNRYSETSVMVTLLYCSV